MKVRIEWSPRAGTALATALADDRLSYRAKGIFAYLLSLPDGQAVDVKALAQRASEGRDAIGTALQELSAAGYCDRIETALVPEPPTVPKDEEIASNEPVMDSLFGESFAPPVRMTDRPELRPDGSEDATDGVVERVIEHLNRLRERHWDWAQYTPLSTKYAKNVEHIGGRLADGYVEQDLILVLDFLAATDGGKEDSRRYFNCVTPFNTKNFEANLAMARDWAARGRRTRGRKRPGTSRGKEYYLGKGEGSG